MQVWDILRTVEWSARLVELDRNQGQGQGEKPPIVLYGKGDMAAVAL